MGLMGDSIYGQSHDGYFFRVLLETGKEVWCRKAVSQIGGENNYAAAYRGMVLGGEGAHTGATRLVALNATDGDLVWDYRPDVGMWNVIPQFLSDDTIIWMDIEGGVWRMGLYDGKMIWRTRSPTPQTFTDGGVMVYDGIAYTCSALGNPSAPKSGGALRAFQSNDGKMLWQKYFAEPCLTWPAVGMMPHKTQPTVVVPTGAFPLDAAVFG